MKSDDNTLTDIQIEVKKQAFQDGSSDHTCNTWCYDHCSCFNEQSLRLECAKDRLVAIHSNSLTLLYSGCHFAPSSGIYLSVLFAAIAG